MKSLYRRSCHQSVVLSCFWWLISASIWHINDGRKQEPIASNHPKRAFGITTSSSTKDVGVDNKGQDNEYQWPDTLYEEVRDMAAVSFLIYNFAYAADVARQVGLVGLDTNKNNAVAGWIDKIKLSTSHLIRSFTPTEILTLVELNRNDLTKFYPAIFAKDCHEDILMISALKAMEERAKASKLKRPLTVEEYDDRHQTNELVYGITKDDIHKRITLIFRGTDNALAFATNWITNLYTSKCQGIVPDAVQAALPGGASSRIWFHSGYYNYVFSLTLDEKDHVGWRKYDEILKDVQRVLRNHPDYKLYVTGHSLGAALATLVAFYLTCEPDIPKPVTCINFASPRIGDGHFLIAVRALEERGWLRILRVVNENDSIPAFPCVNYFHVGMQARLYEPEGCDPEITYPSAKETYSKWLWRLWSNSLPANLNLKYDHGNYRERIEKDKAFLEKLNVNAMYKNTTLTGFDEI